MKSHHGMNGPNAIVAFVRGYKFGLIHYLRARWDAGSSNAQI